MAEFLIFYKDHWFDSISKEEQDILNIDGKFDSRFVYGDIIETRNNGFWLADDDSIVRGWNRSAFVVIRTDAPNGQYTDEWTRSFLYNLDSQDDLNGIYNYTINLTDLSISNKELFTERDRFIKLPAFVSMIEKQPEYIKLRLELPEEIEEKTIARMNFQQSLNEIYELSKFIARRRFHVDLNNLSISDQNLLKSQGWIKVDSLQVMDKGNG